MDISIKKDLASNWFKLLQNVICDNILKIEKNKVNFQSTSWKRSSKKDEGGGEYRILKNGKIFEKVGVNFSKVYGKFPKQFQKNIPGASKDPRFWASGISIVMHMQNPHIPAMHFNTRFICTTKNWFGGGMDVTPAIKDEKERKNFHKILKEMCDRHSKNCYKKYKKWCDEYFYLPHRGEPRGLGGIFYDYLNSDDWEKDFEFTKEVGKTFIETYSKIVSKTINLEWNEKDKNLQFHRRSRYTEFNLLHDRGTKFGLQTKGNVDAILMSLPPSTGW